MSDLNPVEFDSIKKEIGVTAAQEEAWTKYAAAIKDSRFVVFSESAHMPQLEEADRFNALHLAFIDDPRSVTSNESISA